MGGWGGAGEGQASAEGDSAKQSKQPGLRARAPKKLPSARGGARRAPPGARCGARRGAASRAVAGAVPALESENAMLFLRVVWQTAPLPRSH